MKSRKNLGQLLDSYERRLDRLENIFLRVIRGPASGPGAKGDLNYFTIELLNSYRAFNRVFLFSCCKGARSTGGIAVSLPGIFSEYDFIAAVFGLYKGKACDAIARTWRSRDEPPWEADVLSIATKLGLQNLNSIDQAFSISAFYKDMKHFRNFCAHRSQSLFVSARDTALAHNIVGKSIEGLLTSRTPAGQYLPLLWVQSCRQYSQLICT